jgi:glycosyltransferase involved in cell wall biosynthesis
MIMNNLRVCIVSKYAFPHDTRLKQQAEALQRSGVNTDIVCLRWTGQPKVEHSGCVTIYRVRRSHPKSTFLQYLVGTLLFAFSAFWRVLVLSFRHCPNVLVVHTLPEVLVFTATIPKLMGKSVILDARDLSFELLHSRWPHNLILRKAIQPLFRAVERASAAFSDRIITASLGFRERLIERHIPGGKIVTIVNSADDSIFRFHGDRHFQPISANANLIYHGTVAERFGVLIAVRAIHLVQRSLPGTQLHLYGGYDQSYRRLLDQTIEELNLSELVFLNGYRPLAWLYEAMKSVDLGVVPYLKDEFMNLALSTKGFEYAAAGVPIVASRLDSMQAILPENCVTYFEPGNPSDLADKIVDLCHNAEKRRQQVKAARFAYDKVSGNSNARRFRRLVFSLAAKGG